MGTFPPQRFSSKARGNRPVIPILLNTTVREKKGFLTLFLKLRQEQSLILPVTQGEAVPTQELSSRSVFYGSDTSEPGIFWLSLGLNHFFLFKDELYRQLVASEGQCKQIFVFSLYPEVLMNLNSAPLEDDCCHSLSVSLACLQLSL